MTAIWLRSADPSRFSDWRSDGFSGRESWYREEYGPTLTCGHAFCDTCGDCIVCYGDIGFDDHLCRVIRYDNDTDGARAILYAAAVAADSERRDR